MGERKVFFIGLCFWLYISGMICFFSNNFSILCCSVVISSLTLLCAVIYRWYRLSFLVCFFVAGMLVMQMHEFLRQKYTLLISQASKIQGRIIDLSPVQQKPWLLVYTIVVDSIDDQNLYYKGNIKSTMSRSGGYKVHDVLLLEKDPNKKKSKREAFDLFLAKEGLWGWLFSDIDRTQKIAHVNSWTESYFLVLKQRTKSLYHGLSEPARTLYGSIFLGIDKVLPSNPLKRSFNQWGIVHYLARSGLHIMIFVFIWKMIFYCFFGVRRTWFYFVFPFVFIYVLCTPSSISFMRGVCSFFFLIGALFLQRPYHMPHLLVCLAAIFLTCNPYSMFFLDFQLSFGLTYALLCLQEAYYTTYVQNKLKKR